MKIEIKDSNINVVAKGESISPEVWNMMKQLSEKTNIPRKIYLTNGHES